MEYNKKLYEAVETIATKYVELNKEIENDPTISVLRVTEINKQIKKAEPLHALFLRYKKIIDNWSQDEKIIATEAQNTELYELAQMDLADVKEELPKIEDEIKIKLLPSDPNDDRNVVIEMRPAAGGDEASIFVADLFNTYKLYAEAQGWKLDVLEVSTNAFGYDYIFFGIKGTAVFSKMKFESGVHRVQRVPVTDSKGRIQTSTITVAVMPEFDELDFKINPTDLRIDTYRAGGKGGQHVNRTDSAVRITHLPTGAVAACSDERSQIENRARAMKLLLSKIWEKMEEDRANEISSLRKNQVGTGDRSEKIRTYNYPQSRVTDHRIGLTLNKLDYIMQGNLDEIIDALTADEQARKMSELKI